MTKDNTLWMQCYSTEHRSNMSYVSADGNYGSDEILVFPYHALTESQWDLVMELSDSNRLPFIYAVVNGQDTSAWDQDWDQNDEEQ